MRDKNDKNASSHHDVFHALSLVLNTVNIAPFAPPLTPTVDTHFLLRPSKHPKPHSQDEVSRDAYQQELSEWACPAVDQPQVHHSFPETLIGCCMAGGMSNSKMRDLGRADEILGKEF